MVRPARSFLFPIPVVPFLCLIATASFAGVRVRGTVVDPQERPIAGATVRLEGSPGSQRAVRSDAAGAFSLDEVPAGRFTLRAFAEGFQGEPVEVDTSSASAELVVDVRMRISAVSDTIVVSAAAVDAPLSSIPASTTLVTGEDLRLSQAETVSDLLRRVPGASIAASGGRGSVTSLFPRGGESDSTLVVLDGVRLNSFGGGFDFAHLPAAGLERVEVVRGPQSALFGADAIGGVVQMISRRQRPFSADGLFEGGTYDTRRAAAGAGGSLGSWSAHGAGQYLDTNGRNGEGTADGEVVVNDDYLARSVGGGAGFSHPAGEVRGTVHWMSNERGNPGPFGSDPNGTFTGIDSVARGSNDQLLAGVIASHALTARLGLRAEASLADLDSAYHSSYGDSFSDTRRGTARGQLDWAITDRVAVSAGAEWLRERADNTYITGPAFEQVPVQRGVLGTFTEVRYDAGGRLFAAAGLRAERITRDALPGDPNPYSPRPDFGDDTVVSWNPKVAVSWYVRPPATTGAEAFAWTRLRANAGTGIRPPDAFEIAFTDNPGLKPERSRSVDAGVEQALAGGRVIVDATWFFNRYDDLIVAVGRSFADASRYRTDNVSNARSTGVELAAAVRAGWGLRVRAGVTWLDTEILAIDGTSAVPSPYAVGDPLIRRPRRQGFLDLSVVRDRFDVFARLQGRGDWLDIDPTYGAFGGTLPAPGFVSADAGASWRPLARTNSAVFIRVTNLANRACEEVLGFPAPGRSVIAGVRLAAGF